MAKRKCLNKRLSGYNRYSVGSAILNSDTDILEDEYPYWWKDVESASMACPSIDLNAFNQSSRQLDSTSRIETSQVSDGWWKVLEVSNVPNSTKMNIDNMQKDSNIVTTSESEEESRIVKKKFPLRSRTKKNKSNIFLNVLNDSETTTHEETKSESSMTISTSNSKTITNVEQVNEIQESSLNQSEVANVLKLKPNIYKKNYKNRNKNVFIDVLKENQSETLQKGKISSSNEAPIITESVDSATTENTVLSQPVLIQHPLSFEKEHNFSSFPPPKAQSTILENSTSSVSNSSNESNNSNTVYKVLKPKSKLLTLNRKNTKKNLFENVFEKERSLNKVEKNATVDEILTISTKHSLKSSKISKAAADTIDEQQNKHRKEIKTSSTSKIDERKISEDSTTSNDESDRNRDYSTVQRFKSKFLTRLRKNRKKNPFQDIFEENSDVDTLIASPLERTLIRSTEKISTIKDPTSTQNIFKSKGNRTINSSVIFRTNLLDDSSEEDFAMNIKGDKTNTSLGKNIKMKQPSQSTTDTKLDDRKSVSNKQIMSVNNLPKQSLSRRSDSLAAMDTVAIESTATHDKPKERSSRLSKLQKSFLGSIDESKSQEVKSISQRKSKRLSNKKKESVSSVLNKDESSRIQDVSKRQSKRLSKLQDDNVESTSQRSTRTSSRIREQLVSPVVEVEELTKIQDTSKTQSKRSNNLSKYSFLHSTGKQEQEGIENISQRSIRSLSRIQEQTVSPDAETDESTKIQSISQRQSNRLSNLSKHSFLHSTSKEKQEDIENISQRSIRSLSRMQEQTVSPDAETDESTKIQSISQRQSNRLSNLSKHSFLHSTSKEKQEDIENISQRSIRSLSRMQEQTVSPDAETDESTKIQSISQRQSNRLSNLSKHSFLHSTSKEKQEDIENIPQRSIRSLSRMQEQTGSFAAETRESPKIQDTSKTQSKRLSNVSKYSSLHSTSKQDPEGIKNMSQRSIRSLSRMQEQSVLPVAGSNESTKIQNISKRQNKRLSNLSKHSTNMHELEEIENTLQQNIRSLSFVQEQSVSSATDTDESTDTQDISKRQSKRLNNLPKNSSLHSTNMQELEDLANTSQRNIRSLSRVQEQSVSSATDTDESTDTQDISKRHGKSLSKLEKYKFPRPTTEQKGKNVKLTLQRSTKSLNRMQEPSLSPVTEVDEKIKNVSKIRSRSLSRVSKRLSLDYTSEEEGDDVESISQKNTGNSNRVQTQLVAEVNERIQDIPEEQGNRLSKSKHLSLHSAERERHSDEKSIPQKSIRSMSTMRKQSASFVTEADKPSEMNDISKNQTKSSNRASKHSSLRFTNVGDLEDDENFVHHSIKSLSRTQNDRAEIQSTKDILNSRSNRTNMLQKCFVLLTREDMIEELIKDKTAKQKDNANKATKQFENVGKDIQSSQSNIFDKARKRTYSFNRSETSSEFEMEEIINRPKRRKTIQLDELSEDENDPVVNQTTTRRIYVTDCFNISEDESDLSSIKNVNASSNKIYKNWNSLYELIEESNSTKELDNRSGLNFSKRKGSVSVTFRNGQIENLVEHSDKDESDCGKPSRAKISYLSISRGQTLEDNHKRASSKFVLDSNIFTNKKHQSILNFSKGKESISITSRNEDIENELQHSDKDESNFGKSSRARTSPLFVSKGQTIGENRKRASSKLASDSSIFTNKKHQSTLNLEAGNFSKGKKSISITSRNEDIENELQHSDKDESNFGKSSRARTSPLFVSKGQTIGENRKRASSKLASDSSIFTNKKHQSTLNLEAGNFSKGKKSISITSRNEDIENELQHSDKDESNFGKSSRARTSHLFVSKGQTIGENRKRASSKLASDSSIFTNKKHQSTLNFEAGNFSKGKESISITARNEDIENESQHSDTDESNFGKSSRARTSHLFVSKGQTIGENRKRASSKLASDSSIFTNKKHQSTLNFEAGNFSKGKESISITARNEDIENESQHSDTDESNFGKSSRARTSRLFVSKGQTIEENCKEASIKPESLMSSIIRARLETESKVSKRQQSIRNFLMSDKAIPASQMSENKEKLEEVRQELEKMKKLEIAHTKENEKMHERKPTTLQKNINEAGRVKKLTSQKQRLRKPTKPIHKAFLVNGQVYKVKRLPRPQRWVTDRLYNYLWKRMEPKYKLETKSISEKFIHQLSSVTTVINKHKSYVHYKSELFVLMKEMARLGIIRTRNDFYNFCHDFFPYSLRVKTVPMLLPGNKRNIPYDARKLHEPLFDS